MYARGIPAADRMGALKLLGVLLDNAGKGGRVRFDADVLAAELAAGINESHRYYRWLEATGVVRRDSEGWRIEGYEPATTSVSTVAALDVLARHLDRERAERGAAPESAAPARPAPGRPAVVPIDAGRRRVAVPMLAGVAAAAVIAWVIALVNTAVGPTATQIAIEQPLAQAATRQPGTIMLAAPAPVSGAGGSTQVPAAGGPGAAVTDTRSATPGALASCAPARPRLRFDRVSVVSADEANDSSGSTLRPGWIVLVTGTVENPGSAPLEVRAFDVEVTTAETTLTTSGLKAPVMLPAATASPWTTLLYAGRDEPSTPRAQALLRDWNVAGPASC